MKFTIVIPTHNRMELVQRAVASVAAQQGKDYELIIVDDGSEEAARQWLEGLDVSLSFLRVVLQDHAGAAAARNRGAEVAKGDTVLFLDSDDELLPDALERFHAAFAKADVGAVCSCALTVDSSGERIGLTSPRPLGPAYEDLHGLFLAGTFAIRRDVFLAIGGFAPNCRSSQHTEFALRLAPYLEKHRLRLVCIDEPTVRIHVHEEEHLRGNMESLLEGALYIVQTHRRQLMKSPKHLSDWCTIAAVYAAKLRKFTLARNLLGQAIRAYPRKTVNYVRWILTLAPPVARRVWRAETMR